MTMHRRRRLATTLLVLAALLTTSAAVWAQESASPAGKGASDLWDDFVYYVKIARPELAKSFARALLDSGTPAKEVYKLSSATDDVELLLNRAERMPQMKPLVDRLRETIDTGYEQMREDPTEIAASIAKLTEGARAYTIARKRLIDSGEFALPQMIQKLTDADTKPQLKERIISVLPHMGRGAVRPLSVALQTTDDKLLNILVDVLKQIKYPHAVPRLRELYETRELLPATKEAVARTIVECAGPEALEKPLASLFYEAALGYYNRNESLLADPRWSKANVWAWKEGLGLEFHKVPREIFCDLYAMRMSRLTLVHDPQFYPAVSLWLAATIRKEANLPAGSTDPLHGDDQPLAAYYVRAAGARYGQQVLARAMSDYDARVAVAAIKALADTAGAKSLVIPIPGGAQPLVEALTYPDRQVRYLAAVSLANALPDKRFVGSPLVLSVLNEALRQRGQKTALLIAAEDEQRNVLKDGLRSMGFEVLDVPSPDKAIVAGVTAGGVDLVMLTAKPSAFNVLPLLRQEPIFAATPVVVSSPLSDDLRDLAKKDERVVLMGSDTGMAAITKSIESAVGLVAGEPFRGEDVTTWAVRAADAVYHLGLTANGTFDIERARLALAGALMADEPSVRVASARALAVLPSAAAQQAILALATDPAADIPIRVSGLGSLAASVRRFGNQLNDAHAKAILAIVTGNDPQDLRQAAAQVLGAMNLPSEQVRPLILQTVGHD
ncbi:hypothetical protein LCGC14_0276390 [marine sediment metagenome]|uniref:HEAT repeat domain-containing protein n=1 Tax=marine sediment metagenome TaxID=412755 RepID=A0A0F9WI79_9ZZZZ|nr:hypothetical protein [Phycisphaerae bacterium]HDZ43912.1 hypothetical protein [Phycisphaerae bacterium]